MSDSDSECEMVKVKSFQGHKFAPSDKNFSIIIKPKEGKKRGFMYTLNSGQTLPYAPTIIGKVFSIFEATKKRIFPHRL